MLGTFLWFQNHIAWIIINYSLWQMENKWKELESITSLLCINHYGHFT